MATAQATRLKYVHHTELYQGLAVVEADGALLKVKLVLTKVNIRVDELGKPILKDGHLDFVLDYEAVNIPLTKEEWREERFGLMKAWIDK